MNDSLAALVASIKPRRVITSIDRAHVLTNSPATAFDKATLDATCRKFVPIPNGKRPRRDRDPVNLHGWKERWDLHQPDDDAFQYVHDRGNCLLNYVEFVLDLIFASDDEARRAFLIVVMHLVMTNRRGQRVRFVIGKTGIVFYSSSRELSGKRVRNVLAIYFDKPSKVTGDKHCLHFCWRVFRAGTLRRIGIDEPADVIKFDHRAFWQRRLILKAIDHEKLGRTYRQHHKLSSPEKAENPRWKYNADLMLGGLLERHNGPTPDNRIVLIKTTWMDETIRTTPILQNTIDELTAQGMKKRNWLIVQNVDHWMPEDRKRVKWSPNQRTNES